MKLKQRLGLYIKLTRLDRPIGILLLLWPTLWGLWIAGAGHPAWHIVSIFVLGTVLMRSAGCVINDYARVADYRHTIWDRSGSSEATALPEDVLTRALRAKS